MKLDVLVFAAHPDDAELSCSGTILSCIDNGLSVGMLDLTKGELGTRGNQVTRQEEAKNSAKLLKVKFRDNITSLSVAAEIILKEMGYDWSAYQGPIYWSFKGKTLSELRRENE